MTHFPRTDANRRAPRVQLSGSIAAAIHVEDGRRARAKLQSISSTGGLLQLQKELATGDFVEIAFPTRSGAICAMAEMLPRMREHPSACLQPFRFIALGDEDARKLRVALESALDRDSFNSTSEPASVTEF